jgi:short-subunit dehydrogenase
MDLSPQEIEDLIRVNIFTQVFMTKYARQVMLSDRKNAFVHLSSILGETALPFHGVYSGTKTFNRVFGKLMSSNHKTNKAETLVVKPSGITTGMT